MQKLFVCVCVCLSVCLCVCGGGGGGGRLSRCLIKANLLPGCLILEIPQPSIAGKTYET